MLRQNLYHYTNNNKKNSGPKQKKEERVRKGEGYETLAPFSLLYFSASHPKNPKPEPLFSPSPPRPWLRSPSRPLPWLSGPRPLAILAFIGWFLEIHRPQRRKKHPWDESRHKPPSKTPFWVSHSNNQHHHSIDRQKTESRGVAPAANAPLRRWRVSSRAALSG